MTTSFDSARCREVDRRWCRDNGFPPNRFFRSTDDEQVIYLLTLRGRGGDFPLNRSSLDYLASREGVTGIVVLAEADLSQVALFPVGDVASRLVAVPPRDGKMGPYWWLLDNGEPARGLADADAAPF